MIFLHVYCVCKNCVCKNCDVCSSIISYNSSNNSPIAFKKSKFYITEVGWQLQFLPFSKYRGLGYQHLSKIMNCKL